MDTSLKEKVTDLIDRYENAEENLTPIDVMRELELILDEFGDNSQIDLSLMEAIRQYVWQQHESDHYAGLVDDGSTDFIQTVEQIINYDISGTDASDLMDTKNGHDETLVRAINENWRTRRNEFKPILIAMYTRDINGITNSDSFKRPEWLETYEYNEGYETGNWEPYNQRCLNDMTNRWDTFAPNYLTHIADDRDLETILGFMHAETL